MSMFEHEMVSPKKLREQIYSGSVFHLRANAASQALVDAAREVVVDRLGDDYRQAHERLDDVAFFETVGEIRKTIYLEQRFHDLVANLVESFGMSFDQFAFDPARIRVVAHDGHENPRAAPVYYGHRDTWYAHPQSLITWWTPLDDLREEETFVFYPEMFDQVVPNDSEIFDYPTWVENGWGLKIGWQNRDHGLKAKYPSVTDEFDPGPAFGFSAQRADNLLFAGSHFHQTREQSTGQTRFSLDFRIVHLRDEENGLGAPNVDNRSTGSCLVDYIRPE